MSINPAYANAAVRMKNVFLALNNYLKELEVSSSGNSLLSTQVGCSVANLHPEVVLNLFVSKAGVPVVQFFNNSPEKIINSRGSLCEKFVLLAEVFGVSVSLARIKIVWFFLSKEKQFEIIHNVSYCVQCAFQILKGK